MIARNSHNRSQAVILQQNPIRKFSQKRLNKIHEAMHSFRFRGTYLELQAQLEGLTQEAACGYVDADISVSGLEMQAFDRCCFVCTWLWAGLLLFPFFLPCTDCWKRRVFAAETIDIGIYRKLSIILKSHNLKSMRLKVNDSNFNQQKAILMLSMIKDSSLQRFIFENQAGEYDFEEVSYSTFEDFMSPFLKQLTLSLKLRWGRKILQK